MRSGADWQWFGYAGHLIVSSKCRYHLTTYIPRVGVLVSTVGDYHPGDGRTRDTIGSGPDDYFETMVFPCTGVDANGDPIITDLSGLDCVRYAKSLDAERGHYEVCWRFHKKGTH